MPHSMLPDTPPDDAAPRAFILRIRTGQCIVTVADVAKGREAHFPSLTAAFANIRKAMDLPEKLSEKPH